MIFQVTFAQGFPGPFANLGSLQWGDQITIHANGYVYTYEVRFIRNRAAPFDTGVVTQHEEYDWITLLTCRDYDVHSNTYRNRTVVRAVLVAVE
ncbi:MAG: sortase [Anaerolineales bacterium]|nr:sortase [Anaerolineales bacterium]